MATKKMHDDVAMDRKAIASAVGKHESGLHKGQPKTKLASGGVCRGTGAAIKGKAFKRNG